MNDSLKHKYCKSNPLQPQKSFQRLPKQVHKSLYVLEAGTKRGMEIYSQRAFAYQQSCL